MMISFSCLTLTKSIRTSPFIYRLKNKSFNAPVKGLRFPSEKIFIASSTVKHRQKELFSLLIFINAPSGLKNELFFKKINNLTTQ